MNYSYSDERPSSKFLAGRKLGQPIYGVNAFVKDNATEEGKYRFISVVLPLNTWDKASIVNALIRIKYPIDKMEAVNNNYLLALSSGDEDGDAVAEFRDMQEWRKLCKEEAEKIISEN